jgi:hypothetical protein
MDDLIADSQSILRLMLSRRSMATASRVCTEWAQDRRRQQLVERRRILRLGASATFLSAVGLYYRSGTRWGGYRTRYRRSQQPISRVKSRQLGPVSHRPITVRGFARNQLNRWLSQVAEMRRLAGKASNIERNHRIDRHVFRRPTLLRIHEPRKYLRYPLSTLKSSRKPGKV